MTEEPKVGNDLGDGAVSPPVTAVSDPNQKPIEAVVTREEFSDLTKQLQGLQGRQDLANTQLSGQQEVIARYQEKIDGGLTPAKATEALAAEDEAGKNKALFARLETFLDGADGKATGSGVNVRSETTRLIGELGLDANNAEVNRILGKGLSTDLEELELRRHASRPARAASAPPPKTPEPVGRQTDSSLANDYIKKVQELPRGPQSRSALSTLKDEYTKLGVDVNQIGFD